MHILGIIPARYASTRFPAKPLADIGGKPMVWWVHRALAQVRQVDSIVVACDDERIAEACRALDIPAVMTRHDYATHLDRLAEVARKIPADFYLNVNGDEPLMEPDCIRDLLPPPGTDPAGDYAANAMAVLTDAAKVIDTGNGKVVCDARGYGLYISRAPIPYPKASADFVYKKFVGVQCFSKSALAFCAATARGELERVEDCDEFRFLENGFPLKFILTQSDSFSVDTPADLQRARAILEGSAR